jgi:hypothetical protein
VRSTLHHAHPDILCPAQLCTKWDPAADADVACLVHTHGVSWQRNTLEDVVGQHACQL